MKSTNFLKKKIVKFLHLLTDLQTCLTILLIKTGCCYTKKQGKFVHPEMNIMFSFRKHKWSGHVYGQVQE